MSKKIIANLNLKLNAGQATTAGNVSALLGSLRVNTSSFVKEYNEKTRDNIGSILPVKITVYEDRSYIFNIKTPPTSSLILKYANLTSGFNGSKKIIIGSITEDQLKEIATIKLVDLNTKNIVKAMSIVEGTAKNMGIIINNFIN